MAERLFANEEVTGSSPVSRSKIILSLEESIATKVIVDEKRFVHMAHGLKTPYFRGCLAAYDGKGLKEANPYKRRDFRGAYELGWLDVKQGRARVIER